MDIIQIDGYKTLKKSIEGARKAWLILFKSDNSTSVCALENMAAAAESVNDLLVLSADVSVVRDIHIEFEIKTVPVLLQFENGKMVNLIKGCQSVAYYQNLLEEASFYANLGATDEKPSKRVIVYSTPTCSWCNTLKNHLRHHHIRFNDVDVSKDQLAAQAMVAKSGQQGVPQTDIDGEIIVGFDKNRINKILNIQG